MPYASIALARNDILALFKTAWDAQAGTVPLVIYDNVAQEMPATGAPWLRVSIKHNTRAQVTIGGAIGARRFRQYGMFVGQLFTPTGQGLNAADQYVKVLMDAFEGSATKGDGAFFYNVRSNEVGQDDNWFQTNFIAEFQWDSVH